MTDLWTAAVFIHKNITSEKMLAEKFKLTWGEVLLEPLGDNEPQRRI